jgi:hypothetical protein
LTISIKGGSDGNRYDNLFFGYSFSDLSPILLGGRASHEDGVICDKE